MEVARERHGDRLLDAKRAVVANADADVSSVEREAVCPGDPGERKRGGASRECDR
jgi:hypothetical protein